MPAGSWIAGASLLAGGLGAAASESAASTQAGAAEQAQQISENEFNTITAQENPYNQAGYGSLSQLNYLLGVTARPVLRALKEPKAAPVYPPRHRARRVAMAVSCSPSMSVISNSFARLQLPVAAGPAGRSQFRCRGTRLFVRGGAEGLDQLQPRSREYLIQLGFQPVSDAAKQYFQPALWHCASSVRTPRRIRVSRELRSPVRRDRRPLQQAVTTQPARSGLQRARRQFEFSCPVAGVRWWQPGGQPGCCSVRGGRVSAAE